MLWLMITDLVKRRAKDFSQVTFCISSAIAVFQLQFHLSWAAISQHSRHLVLITLQSVIMSKEEQCELMPELHRLQQAT